MKFGELIRQKRESLGISQISMGPMIGVSSGYISSIECGHNKPPAKDKVRKIAKILDLDVDELLALAYRTSPDPTNNIRRCLRKLVRMHWDTRGISTNDTNKLIEKAEEINEILDRYY